MSTLRRAAIFLITLIGTSAITLALKSQFPQQEKEANLRLTKGEIEVLYNIIDESATPGSVRKPLLQKIEEAYRIAFTPVQPQPKDTTKPKKN